MTFQTISRTRRSAALAAAALAMTTVGAGVLAAEPASAAGSAKVNATIKLQAGKSKVGGKLASPKAACEKGKQVKLHFQEPGDKKFVLVADDTSNASGAWSIHAPGSTIPPGKYFVTVKASSGCKAARSKTIKVG